MSKNVIALYRRSGIALLALAVAMPVAAHADNESPAGTAPDDAGSGVDAITVTARYRKEDAQKVPIAITALSEMMPTKEGKPIFSKTYASGSSTSSSLYETMPVKVNERMM